MPRGLGREAFDLKVVSHPNEARTALTQERPDLFLTDSIGLELLPELKAKQPPPIVVVYSGKDGPEALPDGVRRWFSKSIEIQELKLQLELLLQKEGKP